MSAEPFDRFVSAVRPSTESDHACREVWAGAQHVTAKAGDMVVKPDLGDLIVFITRGALKLVARSSHGKDQIVTFHFACDLVPLSAREAATYSLCALADCDLTVVPMASLLARATDDAALPSWLIEQMALALRRCREQMVILGRKTAQERVAGFLSEMAVRIGTPANGTCVLRLPMSRRDIADSLGLTIETISRQLGCLRDCNIIQLSGRSIVRLLDIQELARKAGNLPNSINLISEFALDQ